MRISYVYLQDAALAEDAVQETFIKAYQALDSFRDESKESTWLTRIAINTCKDMKRNSWFRLFDRRVSLDQLPEPIQRSLTEEDGWLMEDILNLPDREKDVVLMYYYQGMSVYEVGKALNLHAGTVSKRLEKARRRLRGILEGGNKDGSQTFTR
ncbi:MAG: sigma-70 family RNA polymerase sigma factor [Christensenellaceae bacterium]|nr:sigma-70 family RNA polymerase sigma factor [Christensenellaceae bacterium]